jgi:cytochrome bd-type quinol oxidase subunit 2
MDLATLITGAKEYGIFDFFLPFILMFAIFYGLLIKTKIFGQGEDKQPTRFNRTISMVISLVAAAYIMIYTPAGITLSTFFANLFGQTLVVVMSLLGFLVIMYLLMNVLQPGATWDAKRFGWLVAIVIIIAIVLGVGVFLSSGGAAIFPGIKTPITINLGSIDPGTLSIIVVIVLTGVVIYFLARSEGGEGRGLEISRR